MSELYSLVKRLFPIHRSITGDGNRETLGILSEVIQLNIHEIPTGTRVYDWVIPEEWSVKEAYIENSLGKRVIDIANSNLHILGYSDSFDGTVSLDELKKHLFSIEKHPDWIPYITSYYSKNWGFCISHNDLSLLADETYYVKIDSTFKNGSLTYGDLLIAGETEDEVLISVNICHPSMANNELAGVVIATHLAKYISGGAKRRYSYRFIFVPETIGSIAYIFNNQEALQKNVVAGYVLTCIGDSGKFSYLRGRTPNTLTEKITMHVLENSEDRYNIYNFTERGSDERQYCSPGIDLPIGSLMRSRYNEYDEYHTSADNLDFISADNINESLEKCKLCVDMLDQNKIYKVITLCEPQLGRRNLYPDISTHNTINIIKDIRNVLGYCDGKNDILTISEILKKPMWDVIKLANTLLENNLIIEV